MLSEHDFQKKADAAFEDLKKRLLLLGDQHDFDVERNHFRRARASQIRHFTEHADSRNLDLCAFHKF
jgi:hypothetical protein